jgi:hypothetical protein
MMDAHLHVCFVHQEAISLVLVFLVVVILLQAGRLPPRQQPRAHRRSCCACTQLWEVLQLVHPA